MLKFKPSLLLLTVLALSSCKISDTSFKSIESSFDSSSSNNGEPLKPFKVYDIYLEDAGPQPGSFVLEEFDDNAFYVDEDSTITNKTYGTIVSYGSAVYIYDANNDGYRDFCAVKSDGSGVIYWYVTIYDLHNKQEIFKHWERGRFSYFLSLKDNDLYVKQVKDYYTDPTINEGKLSFDNSKGVYLNWNKNYDITDFDTKMTFANPNHTPVTINKDKDVYHVTVDNVSHYFFDVDIHANANYGDDYLPVSFAMSDKIFTITSVSKTDSLQRYCFSFNDYSAPEVKVLINISNITKTFIFTVSNNDNYQTLGDVFSWSKDIASENMTMFETEFEMNSSSTSLRQINRHYNKAAFEKALSYFNEVAFEVSPDDFGFLESNPKIIHIYRFYLGEQMHSFQTISSYVESNGKWYKLRVSLSLGSYEGTKLLYAFPSNTAEAKVYNLDNTETGKTVNYLSELVFSQASFRGNILEEAKYYFTVGDAKYYILSSKEFAISYGNYGYLYTIVSDIDFSSLF